MSPSTHYDVVIIGAGMSGLSAGIRLAYYGKSVCVVDRHYVCGGLNSYYSLGGRRYDVGLHAMTNYTPVGAAGKGPLVNVLRQLRLKRDQLKLDTQHYSEVRFPSHRLRFSNDPATLRQSIADVFPDQLSGFDRLLSDLSEREYSLDSEDRISTRAVLADYFTNQALIEMLLCPVMYYGSAQERDMDFSSFAILFRSILVEGLARPSGGVRTLIGLLVKSLRACGGKLMLSNGVRWIETDGTLVKRIHLESGETLTADKVLSSAGFQETMHLCSDSGARGDGPGKFDCEPAGKLSFVEAIFTLDKPAARFGIDTSILFFNNADTFTYERPAGLIDRRSGVICCPDNFGEKSNVEGEGCVRVTMMANYDRWAELDSGSYEAEKQRCYEEIAEIACQYSSDFRDHVVAHDLFTPTTIERFTGHLGGAVYGSASKLYDGCTRFDNLFICGTDQGFLGIIGAMLSGILTANEKVLADPNR